MRTSIFYFSGTGNCLKAARDLADELGGADVISIPKAINEKIDFSSERSGIIFPVYIFGIPLIVVEFIKKIQADANKDKYFFAVATYGGILAGALEQTALEFKKQGLKLSAGFAVRMPGNYTPLYGAIPVKKQQRMFAIEREKIKTIAQIIKEGKQQKIDKGWILFNPIFSFIYKMAAQGIHCADKDFWADKRCNSCGVCEKVCPVKNIKLTDGRPVWFHKCEQCFACLQWCPQEAIQYKKSTIGRKRYRNHEVKMEDFFNK